MSNGKRRTNWETVLEERMAAEREWVLTLNDKLYFRITDLENKVNALHKKSVRYGCILAIIASIGLLTAVLK